MLHVEHWLILYTHAESLEYSPAPGLESLSDGDVMDDGLIALGKLRGATRGMKCNYRFAVVSHLAKL